MTKEQVLNICRVHAANLGFPIPLFMVKDRILDGAEEPDEVDWIVHFKEEFDGFESWGFWLVDDVTGEVRGEWSEPAQGGPG